MSDAFSAFQLHHKTVCICFALFYHYNRAVHDRAFAFETLHGRVSFGR